ncbi:MAG: peptide MFS transporter [Saprospiraceae bacterium]
MNKTFFGHPIGLSTLFFTEMWERFSYYGMRALLVLFMTAPLTEGGLAFNEETSGAIYGLYTCFVYLLALPGGWIADRLIGARKAIWYGGIIIMIGHFILAIPNQTSFFIGLVFVVVGTGLLKPNVSAVVGDLYSDDEAAKRDAGFYLFYMGINIGAVLGPLLCGYFAENVNWHLGFALAGFGMALGLIQYRIMAPNLGEIGLKPNILSDSSDFQSTGSGKMGILFTLITIGLLAALQMTGAINLFSATGLAEATIILICLIALSYFSYVLLAGGLTTEEKKRVIVIFILIIAAAVFWSGFEQHGSSFNLFAQDFTDRTIGPFGMPQFVGPLVALVMFGYFIMTWVKHILNRDDLWVFLKYALLVAIAMLCIFLGWFFYNIIGGWTIPTTWFQSINPFFLITLAPVFGAIWMMLSARNLNPRTPIKFAIGLILVAVGFYLMVIAANIAAQGLKAGAFLLILTYFLHTCGELCLSPVGLSTMTKLAPRRYVSQMMGMWFVGTAAGNLVAGLVAGRFDPNDLSQMPNLFMNFVYSGIGVGILLILLSPILKKWMGKVH